MVSEADEILMRAADHIKDRAAQRDLPKERSMAAAVNAFNAMFGHSLTVEQGWHFMVLLKMSRSRGGTNPDDYEDGAAYFALAGEEASR